MARETGPIGDPKLPKKDEHSFTIDNPSQAVLTEVFNFPFSPHEMEVKLIKTVGFKLPMPFSVTLDSLHPTAGTGEHDNCGLDDFNDVKGEDYDERTSALVDFLKAGFEKVSVHVEKFEGKSGQLALTDNEVEEGTGFETFFVRLLPTLLENGYQVSSVDVHFDTGWFYLDDTPGYDDSSHRNYPHFLKYDGKTLSVYKDLTGGYHYSGGDKRITVDQHRELRAYWENLKALSEQEKAK